MLCLDDKKRMDYMQSRENVTLFLNMRAFAANTVSDSITSVDARHTSTGSMIRFSAPVFIDCTGDGWIGFWAGAEYMYGREDSLKYGENFAAYKDLWSPGTADNRVMGSSVLWRTVDTGKPVTFPDVPWAMDVAGDYSATMGTWKWEYSEDSLHQIEDGEAIRDHMLKAIYGSFSNAKKDSENANLVLEWTSYLLGKRESRRLVGDYIYTFMDEKKMTEFPDLVAMETRDIDVHYQQKLKDPSKPDFLSEALYYKVDRYYIPFRSLYSKEYKEPANGREMLQYITCWPGRSKGNEYYRDRWGSLWVMRLRCAGNTVQVPEVYVKVTSVNCRSLSALRASLR
jgi:hypothetical protein